MIVVGEEWVVKPRVETVKHAFGKSSGKTGAFVPVIVRGLRLRFVTRTPGE